MGQQRTYILLLAAIILLTSYSASDDIGIGFTVDRNEVNKDEKCMIDFQLKGNNDFVNETFSVPCEEGRNIEVLNDNNGVILGDFNKDNLCVAQWEQNELVVILNKQQCNKHLFLGLNQLDVNGLSVEASCNIYKKLITKSWDEKKKGAEGRKDVADKHKKKKKKKKSNWQKKNHNGHPAKVVTNNSVGKSITDEGNSAAKQAAVKEMEAFCKRFLEL